MIDLIQHRAYELEPPPPRNGPQPVNPTTNISKRVRVYTAAADRKRAELRTALAPSTPTGEPMSESALTRRLAGEHTWDVHELALIAENLGVTLADLVAGAETATEES